MEHGSPDLEDELFRAQGHAQNGRWAEARELLGAVLERAPNDADALHLMGCVLAELNEQAGARSHFLQTLELDEVAVRARSKSECQALLDLVLSLARSSVASLPDEFRSKLSTVAVLVELLPARHLVEEGLDPRALAVIEGQDEAGRLSLEPDTLPTRIVLFAHNLAEEFPEPDDLEREVHITVLHEVGHYFGLDEDDMVRLGLD